jgi:hypothetical protein
MAKARDEASGYAAFAMRESRLRGSDRRQKGRSDYWLPLPTSALILFQALTFHFVTVLESERQRSALDRC